MNAGNATATSLRTTYDVRIWAIETYKGKSGASYYVRWKVGPQRHRAPYKTRALADSARAKLLTAARDGVAFDIASGLPITELRAEECSWYQHATEFVDALWARSAPGSRRARADALATITPALLATDRGIPARDVLREALYAWAFNTDARQAADSPPEHLVAAVAWLEKNTIPLALFNDRGASGRFAHAALNRVAQKENGDPAAATTIARKRAVFYGALRYAIERDRITSHPLDRIRWSSPDTAEAVDRRVVVDPPRARQLLSAVGAQGDAGRRLVAFFACIYYAAMRPAEVAELRQSALTLPDSGWGEAALSTSNPENAPAWSGGRVRAPRQLKHRAVEEVRFVPLAPELVVILRRHLAEFGTTADGRLFVAARGGALSSGTYGEAWRVARRAALTEAEAASPLARRPYDLRHAAVSTWLNAGVPATQVAEWAGHSVHVLLRVYAKCLLGQDEASRRRIEAALTGSTVAPDPPEGTSKTA